MKVRRLTKVMFILFSIFAFIFLYHRFQIKIENKRLLPMGQKVEVFGQKMNIFSAGQGKDTLVFMSGGGTSSPILDFKGLYTLLEKEYKIVVLEKFGYGFSDDTKRVRSLENLVKENRHAIKEAGISGPYVLCPHSMSGLESLCWPKNTPKKSKLLLGWIWPSHPIIKSWTYPYLS